MFFLSSNFGELIVNVQHIPQMGEARERLCWTESTRLQGVGALPMVAMAMDFPFQQMSELMRFRSSHCGTWMPIAATVRRTRDGEIPFIRWVST